MSESRSTLEEFQRTAFAEPPAHTESEQAVLGVLLFDNKLWAHVGEALTPGDFFNALHGLIFTVIGELIAANMAADVLTVYERLQACGEADACGGLGYLNKLEQSIPNGSMQAVLDYAGIIKDRARRRRLIAAVDTLRAQAYQLDVPLDAAAAHITLDNAQAEVPLKFFEPVDLANLDTIERKPQRGFWQGYLPAGGHVTLLGGHGGAGKSLLALMLAACIAVGRSCLGKPTLKARVLFFSAEDPAEMVLERLAWICRELCLPTAVVAANLHVLDATKFPVLFNEAWINNVREGQTTPTFRALTTYVNANEIDVLIVDNASDVFDADEIKRATVRKFIRSLALLMRGRDGAVLLLAHVDKSTSRAGSTAATSRVGGTAANGEGYSGSTAWHNSARSRMYMVSTSEKNFELQHQKYQFGRKQEPLTLGWPEHGLLQLASAGSSSADAVPKHRANDERDTHALLALIQEYTARGEFVSTSPTSRTNAKMFEGEATYPRRRKPAEVVDLLREAERMRLVERCKYKGLDRKPRERWEVTAEGCEFIQAGIAASGAANVR